MSTHTSPQPAREGGARAREGHARESHAKAAADEAALVRAPLRRYGNRRAGGLVDSLPASRRRPPAGPQAKPGAPL